MGTKYISRKKNRRGNWVKYRDDRLVTAQQSTGAAQIANLKYILKNGSTGEFVEALDSIINERVRVALGQLVNNLDKGTGLAKVLGIDASNDLGSSSIANLASVLSARAINVHTSDTPILTVQRDSPGIDCYMRFQTGGTSARTNFSFGIEVTDAGTYWKYDLVIIRDTPYKKIILAENL